MTLVVNFHAGPSSGKCFKKGTKILMYDGNVKNVEDIVVGEQVMGPDSKPRNVLSLAKGREMMYEIAPKKGSPYVVNESHILSLRMNDRGGGYKKNDIVNISIKDYINQSGRFKWHAKGYRAGVDFEHKNVPIDPYILGIWLGDGHSEGARVTTMDIEVVNELGIYAGKNNLQITLGTKKGSAATYGISALFKGYNSNKFLNNLKSLDLINNKHIPFEYKVNSRNVRLGLLAGIIDSDGYVKGSQIEITMKNQQMIEDIAFIARSLGLSAYVKVKYKKCYNSPTQNVGKYWQVYISGHTIEIPTKIKRKILSKRLKNRDVLNVGIDVNPIGIDDYFGFETDGDHLFLLGDFTVVHNSTICSGVFHKLKVKGINSEYIQEYAKDKTWEGNPFVLGCQPYITAKQLYRQDRLMGKVDVIVADTSILNGLIYGGRYTGKNFDAWLLETFNSFDNLNIFIERDNINHPYQTAGRNQALEQSMELDNTIKQLLINLSIEFHSIPVTEALDKTMDLIENRLRQKEEQRVKDGLKWLDDFSKYSGVE